MFTAISVACSIKKYFTFFQGRQFDAKGDLRDWWEKETKKKFLKKAECIIHQYGNYSVPEVGLNVSLECRCKLLGTCAYMIVICSFVEPVTGVILVIGNHYYNLTLIVIFL